MGGTIGRTFISNQGITNATYRPIISCGKGLSFEIEYARRFLGDSDIFGFWRSCADGRPGRRSQCRVWSQIRQCPSNMSETVRDPSGRG